MQYLSIADMDRAASIVAAGLMYVADRLKNYPELHRELVRSSMTPDEKAACGLYIVPPDRGQTPGEIRYDPHHVLQLTREHKHPEWVVCARLERLILAEGERWESDKVERKRLVENRKSRRARHEGVRSRD